MPEPLHFLRLLPTRKRPPTLDLDRVIFGPRSLFVALVIQFVIIRLPIIAILFETVGRTNKIRLATFIFNIETSGIVLVRTGTSASEEFRAKKAPPVKMPTVFLLNSDVGYRCSSCLMFVPSRFVFIRVK